MGPHERNMFSEERWIRAPMYYRRSWGLRSTPEVPSVFIGCLPLAARRCFSFEAAELLTHLIELSKTEQPVSALDLRVGRWICRGLIAPAHNQDRDVFLAKGRLRKRTSREGRVVRDLSADDSIAAAGNHELFDRNGLDDTALFYF